MVKTKLNVGAIPYEYTSTLARKTDISNINSKLSTKQDNLVSGINIKTVNNESILGKGNIEIHSSYKLVNHNAEDTTYTLTPNTLHVWGEVRSLSLSLGSGNNDIASEYVFQFTSGSTPTTLTLPSNIKWNKIPIINPNCVYQISILNGLATFLEFNY